MRNYQDGNCLGMLKSVTSLQKLKYSFKILMLQRASFVVCYAKQSVDHLLQISICLASNSYEASKKNQLYLQLFIRKQYPQA